MEPVAASLQAFLSEIFNGWTETQKRRAASRYLQGLQEAYEDAGGEQVWADFMEVKTGVSEQYLADLKALYPELPAGLEALLQFADGTYWREYRPGEKTCLLFLGSDLEEFPYYLLSAKQMMETKDRFADWGKYLILREYDDIPVDEGITHDLAGLRWLHFADCFNNGGCSQLFIDFTPSEKGKAGQIVRYIHDPDELTVIAESFDAYLEMLIENEYDFINEETIEE
ncbi:MAG: SMI1/KNR4 family protein [Oscillibacter sp.]|nr:SMI1/KNR4 family protein [Oscillibacter sp.]